MAPFGSLLAGALAHVIGAPRTVIVSGVACIVGSDVVLVPPDTHSQRHAAHLPKLGIVPQRTGSKKPRKAAGP